MRVSSLPGLLNEVILWIKHFVVRAKCPDCDGIGYRPLKGNSLGAEVHVPCSLCRGKGRI